MNGGPLLFLGFLFSLALSFWGMILAPQLQIGQAQQSQVLLAGETFYPTPRPGAAQRGAQIYAINGCAECHTQQVQPPEISVDDERGWGQRRSVARDYLYDYPVQLGQLRLGPDLSNIGLRQTNVLWHLTHLYAPKTVVEGSTMPHYRFLFEKRELMGETPAPAALPLGELVEPGYEVVPKQEAHELVAYLLSLRNEVSILEAQLPPPPTNQPPVGATNELEASSESASTNAPAE